jgi:Carboxypeptidase regulatory-like domain
MRLSSTRLFIVCNLIALVIALFGVSTLASTPSETVSDSSGKVIPVAKVTATNTATNVTSSVGTDKAGLYVIPNLIPGVYQVNVRCSTRL